MTWRSRPDIAAHDDQRIVVVGRIVDAQQLERDLALQMGIPRAIDLAERALDVRPDVHKSLDYACLRAGQLA